MLVKDVINIVKKYKEYKDTLKELKGRISLDKSGFLEESSWVDLYKEMHLDFVRWMNSPISDDLLEKLED